MVARNMELRVYAKERGVAMWEVAIAMGLSENTLYRRLRELQPEEFKQEFRRSVDRLADAEGN